MRRRNPFLKLIVFLLPAFTALVAYTAFYERLYTKPACTHDCDNFNFETSAERSQKRINLLNYIDNLRKELAESQPKRNEIAINPIASATALDLAFLKAKIARIKSYDISDFSNMGNPLLRGAAKLSQELSNIVSSPIEYLAPELIVVFEEPSNGNTTKIAGLDTTNTLNNLLAPELNPAKKSNSNDPSLIAKTLANDLVPLSKQYIVPTARQVNNASQNPSVSNVPLPKSIYFMLTTLIAFLLYRHYFNVSKKG